MAGRTTTEVASVMMPSGEQLYARVTVDADEVTDSAGGVKRVLGRLENLDDTIRGVVRSVGASVAKYAPAETEIEFGIEVAGETGKAFAVLAGAHAAASVKIKLTWRKGEFPAEDGADDADEESDTFPNPEPSAAP